MAIRQKPSEHRQCNAERVVSAALREGKRSVHTPLASSSEGRSRKQTLTEDVVRLLLGGLSHESASH